MKMIQINIPGWGNMEIENVVLDLNGTIATDGIIPSDVKEKINLLAQKVKVYLLTADTQGSASHEIQGMNVELVKVAEAESKKAKLEFLEGLNPERTIAIGNGSNDQLLLKEVGLGIAVLGNEGVSGTLLKHADVLVININDALNLLLKPKRLMATLRE